MNQKLQAADDAAIQIKRQIAAQVRALMKRKKVNQSELARRMDTSRAVVHRLLQPDDPSVTLATVSAALNALDCTAKIRMFSR